MPHILDVVGLISVATLFGSMAFFSGVVAPFTFTTLDATSAGRFVRGIFPGYYLVIAGLSLLAVLSLVAVRPLEAAVMAMIAFGAYVARQLLMPRINDCRDRMLAGDTKAGTRFTRLHRLSVWINAVQLAGAFAVLVLIGSTCRTGESATSARDMKRSASAGDPRAPCSDRRGRPWSG